MPEISPMRTVGALVLRDLGCTLRTPTVLFMAAFGVLLCWGVAQWSLGFSDIPQARGDLSRFVLDSSAVMPALTGGSVIPLSLMAEEREHGTIALLSRAGASMSAIAASKALNLPYWNRATVSGLARIPSATALGSASRPQRHRPRDNTRQYSASCPLAKLFDSDGSRIVPSATPSTPEGNSIRRSA